MFECLKIFEKELEAEGDENARGIRRGLAILDNEPFINLPSKMPKLQMHTKKKIMQLVCLYRVVDVLGFIDSDGKMSGINPRYSRMPQIGVLQTQRVSFLCLSCFFRNLKHPQEWPMSHWVSTLQNTRMSLTSLGQQQKTSAKPSSSAVGSRLFRDLHHISKQKQGTKILFNFQIAAIHLYFILHGNKLDHRLVCSWQDLV